MNINGLVSDIIRQG